jgi:LysM repeat protein
VVRQNDTIGSIASYYGITRDELIVRNNIQNNRIFIGRELIVAKWVQDRR